MLYPVCFFVEMYSEDFYCVFIWDGGVVHLDVNVVWASLIGEDNTL